MLSEPASSECEWLLSCTCSRVVSRECTVATAAAAAAAAAGFEFTAVALATSFCASRRTRAAAAAHAHTAQQQQPDKMSAADDDTLEEMEVRIDIEYSKEHANMQRTAAVEYKRSYVMNV